ncbi:MAG: pitrilysin family protein [Planctomycetota bacterium]|nr:pitrilysin family protein [Planctomycetota bacterium]
MITSIEGISEYRLDNGVKVLLFPDPSKPTVTVNMTVFVGSRHEGYGESGMAHLLEHMVFKGTPTHQNIPKLLQDRGARFNGTTWVDRTNYYETLPAKGDNLEFAIALEADRLMNSYVKGEDLISEMTVVRNEFERGENSPSRVLGQRMMSAAFQWHNYGKSTIGNRADIERVPIEKLKVFYKKFYQPDNVLVVVAGAFETEDALKHIQKHYGSIARPKRVLDRTYTEEPPQDGEKTVALRRVGEVAVVGAIYHIPAGPHRDYAAIDVLESILTAAPAGRLYKSLVETRRASSVSGAAFAWHDPGVLRFMAEVSEGNAPETVLETMVETLNTLVEKGVSDEEVQRAKDRLFKLREQAASDSSRIAVQLSEWAAQGDWRLYFLYRDRLEKVESKDVNRVARAYLKRNNRTVGLYIPTKEPEQIGIPQTPDVAGMIGDYKGREAVAAGEAFDVSPTSIEERTTRSTLPNGIKVAILPKKTRGETVNFRLTLRYGNLESLTGKTKAADVLAAMMVRGTKKLSRQQIQDELNKHRTQLGARGSAGSVTFSFQTKKPDLPAVLNVLRQILRKPTFPAAELETIKQGQITQIEQSMADPQSIAVTHVNRAINPYKKGDPRYIGTFDEDLDAIKALSQKDVAGLYKDLLGATHGELSIVGDFDAGSTLSLVEEMLSGWKSSQTYERIGRIGEVNGKAGVTDINTPDKKSATYFAGLVFPMRDDHPDYAPLVMGNFVLGAGSLSSRLGNRVRQKEGLSYGVGSGLRSSALDKRATFYMYAIANPTNVPKLKTVIQEELSKLLKDGVTEAELKAAKEGYLQRLSVGRTDDGQLASLLEETSVAKRSMEFQAKLEQRITDLSVDDVNKALRKHIKPERLVIAAAGDFSAIMKDEPDKK